MITDIEDFFTRGCGRCARFATPECSTRRWHDGLIALRGICLDAGLSETLKWAHPCYVHAGRNIAIIGAFRGDFRLSFFNAALMKDPHGMLVRQGANSQHPDCIRFAENGDVAARSAVIASYLQEAMGYAEAGIRPPRSGHAPDMPEELAEALEADAALAAAFGALTPGRQRSYMINLAGAKKRETRLARIEKFRDHILAGKGALER